MTETTSLFYACVKQVLSDIAEQKEIRRKIVQSYPFNSKISKNARLEYEHLYLTEKTLKNFYPHIDNPPLPF